MTVCVPKKPFVLFGKFILYSLLFSWIPFSIACVIFWDSRIWIGWTVMWLPVMFTIGQIYDWNRNHSWIAWCDKASQNNRCGSR